MKKTLRSLITIALCAPLLSGCSLFEESNDFPVETKKISGLSLRDYTKVVLQNQKYSYDGKVYVVYEDKTDKEVTSYCTFEDVDTKTVGEKSFKVKYETSDRIYSQKGYVTVVDSISLEGITISDYSETVMHESQYVFDGKVVANYSDGSTKDVTDVAHVYLIDTSTVGTKKLTITYTEGSTIKSDTVNIEVVSYMSSLNLSGYVSSYQIGEQLDETIKVEVVYSDGKRKDVSSSQDVSIDFSSVDTSTIGDYSVKVSYIENGVTISGAASILVCEDHPKLVSIEACDYTATVDKGSDYVFDGVVTATFDKGEPKIVTDNCTFSTISTTTAGNRTLTISYKDTNWNITKTTTVVIKVITRVTDITCDSYSNKIPLNEQFVINASVVPSNADNTDIVFESLDTSVVIVDENGQVTGISVGTASVVVSAADNPEISKTVEFIVSDEPKVLTINAVDYTAQADVGSSYSFDGKVWATYSSGDPVDVTADCSFTSISTATAGNRTITITYIDPAWSVKKTCQITVSVLQRVTGISVPSDLSVKLNGTAKINAAVLPSNASNKSLTYESNNTNVATVDSNGTVSGLQVGTASITVTSVDKPSIFETVTINVNEVVQDAWTVLLYLCGADLESGGDYGTSYGGQATSDLQEILSVSGQPDDVNFVVQTGGAKAWKTKYGISADNNQRYHVENKQLVKDNDKVYTKYNGMGEASTLKDFLVWGLETYPADKVGLILWNHGGGLDGVCYDEKKSSNSLTNDEVVTAVSGALSETGNSKLEFIGYDACLMQMMEIAEFNSPYFKYQITSQETEAGSGWAYNTWVDDLYAKKSTENILKAIVDGFIEDNGGVNATGSYYQGEYYPADQTLSYLDLSKIDDFKTAWENLASQVKSKIGSSSTNKSNFKNNVVGASKYFAGSDYKYYAEFDCYDFLDKLSSNSTFNPGGNYISNARTALTNLIKYNITQTEGAANAHGLSFYFGKSYNSSTYSNFTNWVSLISTVGGFSYYDGY